MNDPPAVIVHGLDHARTALAAGRPVTLLSAPGAALYGGAGWWLALVAAALAERAAGCGPAGLHSGVAPADCPSILDCADAAGSALEALRAGQACLVLWHTAPGRAAIAAIAAAAGARLLATAPPALDLGTRGAERRLRAWLGGEAGP